MTKRYRITVTEIGEELTQVGGKWVNGAGTDGAYGHSPEHLSSQPYEREVFKQEMNLLNLPNLVKTINPPTPE